MVYFQVNESSDSRSEDHSFSLVFFLSELLTAGRVSKHWDRQAECLVPSVSPSLVQNSVFGMLPPLFDAFVGHS